MAFRPPIVKGDFAYTPRRNRETEGRQDDEILGLLKGVEDDLESPLLSDEDDDDDGFEDPPEHRINLSQTILMPGRGLLDKEKLKALLQLYRNNQLLADEVLPILEDDEFETSPILLDLVRPALAQMLNDEASSTAVGLRLMLTPGIRVTAGLMNISREYEKMLEDYFGVCREPNPAEISMLAIACRLPREMVAQWFRFKRASLREFFVTQDFATINSRIGRMLRRDERLLKNGIRLETTVPPEFTDEALYYDYRKVGRPVLKPGGQTVLYWMHGWNAANKEAKE